MKKGPSIEELSRHLAECPPSFLAEPIQPNGTGQTQVSAVVSDLLILMSGHRLSEREAKTFEYSSSKKVRTERNRLRTLLVASWLGYHPKLRRAMDPQDFQTFLRDGLDQIASLVQADSFVNDPDRREEITRLLLLGTALLPEGETEQEAQDRFDALSTVKRNEVLQASRAAEERARKLREDLARKERERRAASTYGYE